MSRGLSASDRVLALAALQERVRACRSCQSAGYLAEARPIRDGGRASDRVMVVGQAPGARSDSCRRHFSGPAGKTLENWFTRAGFPPGYFRQRVYLTALTRCFPGKNPASKGDRVAGSVELALCRPYLEQELALVEPRLILLVGTLAIVAFLGKVRLEEVVGTIQHFDGRALLPLPHSSPVSRWLNDPENRGRVDRAIELLAESRIKLSLV
jgi:uracil-DNA glycosylase family 4